MHPTGYATREDGTLTVHFDAVEVNDPDVREAVSKWGSAILNLDLTAENGPYETLNVVNETILVRVARINESSEAIGVTHSDVCIPLELFPGFDGRPPLLDTATLGYWITKDYSTSRRILTKVPMR